jgi:flagellar basal-body rod modification protein FlgD
MILQGISDSTAAAGGQAATDQQKLDDDLNRFLNLLITQLQNQDPLDPLDANEFTSQLVQFASVEQQIHQNANLEKLVAGQQNTQVAAMVSYLGTTIEAVGDTVALENGKAMMTYGLGENARETTIAVKNASGQVVAVATGETTSGRHTFEWDGRDSEGTPLADGPYTVEVSAQRSDGSLLDVSTTIFGRVTGASIEDNGVVLSVGAVNVPMESILRVEQTKTADDGESGS